MYLRTPSFQRRQRGVSLIEVLVSVLVLAIGLLGIAAMQATALRNNEGAFGRSQAVMQSYSILDTMRANQQVANAGAYNRARTCVTPAAGSRVDNEWRQWMLSMKQTLGDSDATCGQIACDGTTCTVTVHWDDSLGTYGSAADVTAAQTRSFTTVTRL